MHIDILSLFPEYFRGPLDESIVKRAQKNGYLEVNLVNIRDFTQDKHHRVDDRPYGGGPGMVMMAEPVCHAVRAMKQKKLPESVIHTQGSLPEIKEKEKKTPLVIYLSPQGVPLSAKLARELSKEEHLILLCGHYEGIDERALESEVDLEVSIGDYVLTNGCLAACVLVDTIIRFIPGVLGDERAADEDSFENGMLDCVHYTRPEVFEGKKVPEVLLSGNHQMIASWRKMKALEKTKKVRPDLYEALKDL